MTAQPLEQPIPFGDRYVLTDVLAVGGMAEIYAAQQLGLAGFDKQVVIKRLKPDLAGDPRIVEMFLDEARIGAILSHPNVVHVYDVGVHDDIPFIVMEYVEGEELTALCRRGLSLGRFLPIEHAVELIRQAAVGLGYVHARRSPEGRALDIVHCDISPTNLLVTPGGFVKLIDFGIARAKNQRYRDQSALPGKLSYMSPEQALRDAVDHRSDIFSLGIVLYEITVGRRLFRGPAQDVLDRLTRGVIEPPTFASRSYPGPLESVVMRALERYPSDRYQNAYDLADHLAEFLRMGTYGSNAVSVARYLDELALAEGGQRRPELVTEAEYDHDEDELDFERAAWAGAASRAWDDYEEPEADVAAALGVEVSELQLGRTPAPAARDAEPLELGDVSGSDADLGYPTGDAWEPPDDLGTEAEDPWDLPPDEDAETTAVVPAPQPPEPPAPGDAEPDGEP